MPSHSSCRSLSKSPRRIARVAFTVAHTALPQYFSRFSRHDFEQAQHLAILVLRVSFKTDYRGICQIIAEWPELQKDLKLKRVPHYSTLCRAAQRLQRQFNQLLDQILVQAQCLNLFDGKVCLAIDSTGLEERHASRHYLGRCHKTKCRQRFWTKLATACHIDTHLILAAKVTRGPGNECVLWKPLLREACRYLPIDTALADAAFDSEQNHILGRQKYGVRLTIIPLNPRTHGRKWPQTNYRRQMKRRFLCRVYRQRNQAESTFSQHKRVLGTNLRARRTSTRRSETLLRIIAHNVMILLFCPQRVATEPPLGRGPT